MPRVKPGDRYGRLTVTAVVFSKRRTHAKCLCDCGNTKTVLEYNLKAGHSQSCGCLISDTAREMSRRPGWLDHARAAHFKHGLCNTRQYFVWRNMISRCESPSSTGYKYYGVRGISVCNRWRKSFRDFLSDMGPPPSSVKKYSIGRINNDGNYEPSNCRWETYNQQARNRRTTLLVTAAKICLRALVPNASRYRTVWKRLKRGWNIQRAPDEPSHSEARAAENA